MKTLIAALAISLASALTPQAPAMAAFFDGNKLYEKCSNMNKAERDTNFFDYGVCAGVVATAADSLPSQCITSTATLRQVADVVFNFLRDHPEERDMWAVTLAQIALVNAFCPNNQDAINRAVGLK